MSVAEVRLDIRPTTSIDPRTPPTRGAYLDLDDVTITFGDGWRSDWRPSALESIDNLASALDDLRQRVAEGMPRPTTRPDPFAAYSEDVEPYMEASRP